MKKYRSRKSAPRGLSFLISMLAGLIVGLPGSAVADLGDTSEEAALGAAAALANVVYGPVKVVYSLGGATIAGIAWAFSGGDSEVADTVLTRSVRGTYVLTPEALKGDREIEFVGRSPEYRVSEESPDVSTGPAVEDDLEGW